MSEKENKLVLRKPLEQRVLEDFQNKMGEKIDLEEFGSDLSYVKKRELNDEDREIYNWLEALELLPPKIISTQELEKYYKKLSEHDKSVRATKNQSRIAFSRYLSNMANGIFGVIQLSHSEME